MLLRMLSDRTVGHDHVPMTTLLSWNGKPEAVTDASSFPNQLMPNCRAPDPTNLLAPT